MNNIIKKSLSLVLTLTMIFSLSTTSLINAENDDTLGHAGDIIDVIPSANTEFDKNEDVEILKSFNIEINDIDSGFVVEDVINQREINSFVDTDKDIVIGFSDNGELLTVTNFTDSNNNLITDDSYNNISKNKRTINLFVEKVIKEIENNNQDNNYILTKNESIDTDYWALEWQEKTDLDILNPYSGIKVIIDCNQNTVASFEKFDMYPDNVSLDVSEEEAITVAETYINKQKSSFAEGMSFHYSNIEFTITQQMNIFEEESFDEVSNYNTKYAYKISFNDDSIFIYVDTQNKEIISADIIKAEDAGIYTYAGFSGATTSWKRASTGLKKLGYNIKGSNTTANISSTIKNYWNGYNSYAFYFNGHGSSTALTFNTGWKLTPSDVSGIWHFVYLDACNTGATTGWANAFKINGYSNRAFLGWYNTVTVGNANSFNSYFWSYANTMSIRNAALKAASMVPGNGTTPIRFYGDPNYYGRSY